MAKPPNIRRIQPEDFPQELQDAANKIADVVNQFSEEVIDLFNKKISFENLNREVVSLDVKIDGSGNVVNPPSVKHNIIGKIEGIVCISAINSVNPNIYPNNQPFIGYSLRTGFIDIKAVKGLPNNSQFKLKLEIIGAGLV